MILKKKGQFFIFSGLMLLLTLLIIYSLGVENYYIPNSTKSYLLENIEFETCQVGKLSNGSYIDARFAAFSADVSSYCLGWNYTCNLTIVKQVGAPTNLSLLNYTHYDYSIVYGFEGLKVQEDFNC